MAQNHPQIYAAVGFHPNEAASWNDQSLDELERLASHPKVAAIGEIGLDFYRDRTSPEIQKEILEKQLSLAAAIGKPVIIHCREAMQSLWPIIREWLKNLSTPLTKQPGVFHSFAGDFIMGNEIINHGFMLGINGPVTYKNAGVQQVVLSSISLDHIVLETDSPFLSPHPFRGQRNEPANIRVIAEKMAGLHQCSLEHIAEITTCNANQLFNWENCL